jgi:hypothetical protein
MKIGMQTLMVAALAVVGGTAQAMVYGTNPSTIAYVDSYTQFGDGDVVFALANNSLQSYCPGGFWIKGADPGAKTVIGQLLAAFHSGAGIMVWADNSKFWTGSANPTCQVWNLRTTS